MALYYPKGSAVDEIHKRLELDPLMTIDNACENILSELMKSHRTDVKVKRRDKIVNSLLSGD